MGLNDSCWKAWTPNEHTHYQRKMFAIRAFRLGYESEPQWFLDALAAGKVAREEKTTQLRLTAPDGGFQRVYAGTWVCLDVKGNIFPVHHDVFVDSYDPEVRSTRPPTGGLYAASAPDA